jgi:uroporphyrinogen III methyltransferase/synthase
VAQLLRELRQGRIHVVTFTSASTFESLAESVSAAELPQIVQNVLLASIGPITSAAIMQRGCHVEIEANQHNAKGLAEAIIGFFANKRWRSELEDTKEVSS